MQFSYVATDETGKVFRGKLEAITAREAVRLLRAKKYLVTDVRPFVPVPTVFARFEAATTRMSILQRALLARHLALMIRSGITVDRAFDILLHQAKKKGIRTVLEKVLQAIRRGESLSTALAKYPKVFSGRFVAMVQWGEAGGALADSLEHLATQMEHDRELQSKVRGAMVYPLIIMLVVVTVGVLMAFFVLPQIISVIESFNVELPLLTKIFLGVSQFIVAYGLILLPAFVVTGVILMMILRTKMLTPVVHAVLLKTPLVGNIVRMVNLARMTRAFSSLAKSGMPLLEALAIVSDILGNVHYQLAINAVIIKVRTGVSLGKAFKEHEELIPILASDMILIGEETGRLTDVLAYLAEFYEENVNQLTKNLSQIVEPALLVFVGIIVGVLVLSVIMPIYQLSEAIV